MKIPTVNFDGWYFYACSRISPADLLEQAASFSRMKLQFFYEWG